MDILADEELFKLSSSNEVAYHTQLVRLVGWSAYNTLVGRSNHQCRSGRVRFQDLVSLDADHDEKMMQKF